MSKDQNEQALGKFAEGVNTGKYELFDEAVARIASITNPPPGSVQGRRDTVHFSRRCGLRFQTSRQTSPRWSRTKSPSRSRTPFLRHIRAPLLGMPAPGKKISICGVQFSKFATERWWREMGQFRSIRDASAAWSDGYSPGLNSAKHGRDDNPVGST